MACEHNLESIRLHEGVGSNYKTVENNLIEVC